MKLTSAQKMQAAMMAGLKNLEPGAIAAITQFVWSQFNPDGGFRGRTETSDLYYTVFGLECALALGLPLPLEKTVDYLERQGEGESLDFVHLICLFRGWSLLRQATGVSGLAAQLRANQSGTDQGLPNPQSEFLLAGGPFWKQRALARLEEFRCPTSGYNQVPGSPHLLIYDSFLAHLAQEDLGVDPGVNLPVWVSGIEALRLPAGGYAMLPGMDFATTPVTAAAVTLLSHLGVSFDAQTTGDWLLERAHPQGGFQVTPDAAIPDLLSTATALHALAQIAHPISQVRTPCLEFVQSLWADSGGFSGHLTETEADCEYTFYGLLALGHLCE